ncbi:MAG: alcohol dehydrogenase catalytic domain-containing protein [Gammaproteobacteria bacterium]
MASDIPSQMTAAFIRRRGGVDEIEVGPLPVPTCGPGQILARVEALSVNHVDTIVRSGAYDTDLPMPFVIGRDFVGIVVARGQGVTGVAPGERVWCNSLGYAGRQGAFAEYALAAADRVYPLPPGQDPVEVVSLLHPAATAWLGLFREGALRPGEMVFVGGAGGGVGSASVQLAVAAGARVIATTSQADIEWVRSCGAQAVFDYRDPRVSARVTAADASSSPPGSAPCPACRSARSIPAMPACGASPSATRRWRISPVPRLRSTFV